jgi:hypothetical protein
VVEMVERGWRSPALPEDPVDKLVAMGFGNRELNKQLLEKHNFELQVHITIAFNVLNRRM